MIGVKTETGDGGKGDGGGAGQREGRQWRGRKTAFQVEGRCGGSETKVKLVNKTRVGRVEVRKEWGKGHHNESDSVWKAIAKRELTLCREGHHGDMGSDFYKCFAFFSNIAKERYLKLQAHLLPSYVT